MPRYSKHHQVLQELKAEYAKARKAELYHPLIHGEDATDDVKFRTAQLYIRLQRVSRERYIKRAPYRKTNFKVFHQILYGDESDPLGIDPEM